MPKSKQRTKDRSAAGPYRTVTRSGDRERGKRTHRDLRRKVGWLVALIGLVLLLVGNIGARTGLVALPGDPHHVFSQFGGGVLGIIGVMVATSR